MTGCRRSASLTPHHADTLRSEVTSSKRTSAARWADVRCPPHFSDASWVPSWPCVLQRAWPHSCPELLNPSVLLALWAWFRSLTVVVRYRELSLGSQSGVPKAEHPSRRVDRTSWEGRPRGAWDWQARQWYGGLKMSKFPKPAAEGTAVSRQVLSAGCWETPGHYFGAWRM